MENNSHINNGNSPLVVQVLENVSIINSYIYL